MWMYKYNKEEQECILPIFQPDPICTQYEKPHIQLPLAMYNNDDQAIPNGKKQR